MYYDALRKRVHEAKIARAAAAIKELDITTKIAPCYLDLHQQLTTGNVETVNLPGGRGSCKSSFVSLEIVDKMMHDPDANGVVFRRVAATLRGGAQRGRGFCDLEDEPSAQGTETRAVRRGFPGNRREAGSAQCADQPERPRGRARA